MTRREFLRWLSGVIAVAVISVIGWHKWLGAKTADTAGGSAQDAAEGLRSPGQAASVRPASAVPAQTAAAAPDDALLSFFILSDLHVNADVDYPGEHLHAALGDIRTFAKADSIIINGDLTESGRESDYKELRGILQAYELPPIHANMGNHEYYDIWIDKQGAWSTKTMPNGKTDAQSRKKFLDFFGLEKPYYDVSLNGFSFILLSQEVYQQEKPEVGEGAWYSDAQMEWFRKTMAKTRKNEPVFVMIHQPLPPLGQDGGSHQLIRAREFRDILAPYPNAFVFWGHNHQDFLSGTPHHVEETFHGFNNSSVGRVLNRKYEFVHKTAAQGMYVQVYADKVRLRGREFETGSWIDEADWTVALRS